MILYSLNEAPNGRLSFSWHGFTTEWYHRLFEIPDLTDALVTSLEIAALSTNAHPISYQSLVLAMDTAMKAGYPDVGVTDPSSLAR